MSVNPAILRRVRASRLVSLLLQGRGLMTAHALADALEVSVRTVYRDIEALQAASVPIFARAGHNGGFELVAGYRTRLNGMTRHEVEALFLVGLPGPAADLGLGPVATAARLEIASALPAELRDGADRLQRRFLLDAPGWYHDDEAVPHLTVLADALWAGRAVQVEYRRWKAPTDVTRSLEPFGVVLKSGRWYVVARVVGSARLTSYRVAKILQLEILPDTFQVPDEFDLATWWRDHVANLRERLVQGQATIRGSPEALERLADVARPDVVRATGASTVGADGWRRAVIPIESLVHAEAELLRLGAGVEVLEPPELRERLARTVAQMSTLYAR